MTAAHLTAARDAGIEGLSEIAEQAARAQRAIEHEPPDVDTLDSALAQVSAEVLASARAGERVRVWFAPAVQQAEQIVHDVLDADDE